MDEIEKQIDELAMIANEMWAREFSNNCPTTELRGISWDELCNKVIVLAACLKVHKVVNMDIELNLNEEHYGYYDNVCDAILDLIDIDRTKKELM